MNMDPFRFEELEIVIRVKTLLSLLLVAACCFVFSSEAQAHNAFKKFISSKYPKLKINCNACHVEKQPKTTRNAFGKIYTKLMGVENMSATLKSKKGAEKKEYEKDVMLPAFEKAYEKVKKMTYEEMLEAGLIEGVEPAEGE
ncbi:MAG: hypothetical protein AAFN77_14315 [Planctomycetota bacterium]